MYRKRKSVWNAFKREERRRSIRPGLSRKESKTFGSGKLSTNYGLIEFNENDFNICDIRTSDILNNLNCNNTDGNCYFEQQERQTPQQQQEQQHTQTKQGCNVSSNILWSHNLSLSCNSNANLSNLNLIGANVNRDQIRSEVYIEDGDNESASRFIPSTSSKTACRRLPFSSSCIDENGYAVMRPIETEKDNEPSYCEILSVKKPNDECDQEDAVTRNINFQRCFNTNFPELRLESEGYFSDSNDGCQSSGFGSADDISYLTPLNSPNTSARSIFIDDGIFMDIKDIALPANQQLEMQKKFENSTKSSAALHKKDIAEGFNKVNNHDLDVTASLLNIASESRKNIRQGTPYRISKSNRLTVFVDKLTSSVTKQSSENIDDIYIYNISSKQVEINKPKLHSPGNVSLRNSSKKSPSSIKKFFQRCSSFNRLLKLNEHHRSPVATVF